MKKLNIFQIMLTVVASAALAVSAFVPLWRIELNAPQYPEGLGLLIMPDGIGGDVDIINGLNHYIGMQTLHNENFPEFSFLKYVILGFAGLFLVTALLRSPKMLRISLITFLLFGIIAMADFWKWEYNYGHDLDPNAAIKVPGMAYQPPLIGFKQLLNFGAYSMPALGGWLFVASGLLILTAWLQDMILKKKNKAMAVVTLFMLVSMLSSCGAKGPEAVTMKDKCENCKMNIADLKFAAEIITDKGRLYKFDDFYCLTSWMKKQSIHHYQSIWVSNYLNPGNWIQGDKAYYIHAEAVSSPMQGNFAAFADSENAAIFGKKWSAGVLAWHQTGIKLP